MEDLAYRRMLDLYYQRESPLPADVDQIARLIRMRSHCDSIKNVLDDFFTLTENGYQNDNADEALRKIYEKSDKARQSAQKRWKKNQEKSKAKCERNANANQTQCETDAGGMLPITHNPIPNNPITKSLDFSVFAGIADNQIKEIERIRKANNTGKAKKLTQRVVNSLAKEFAKAFKIGYSIDDCLDEWETRSWKSFKAEWLTPKQHNPIINNQQQTQLTPEQLRERERKMILENMQ